jgi:hypothetical protein
LTQLRLADADLREHPNSKGREFALRAIRDIGNTVVVALNDDNRVVGAASFRVMGSMVKLVTIGSVAKGAGRVLVEFIRKLTGRPLWCKGVATASGFYEAMGMKRGMALAVGNDLAYIYSDRI